MGSSGDFGARSAVTDPTNPRAEGESTPTPARIRPAARIDPLIGAVLGGRYRIIDRIGRGGMGVVYLAEHVILGKRVAVKVVSDHLTTDGELTHKFIAEARAVSRIRHENIVDVTDFGETPGGRPFLAMEYLEGHDLAQVIARDGPLPFDRVQRIAEQLCWALSAAHAAGIVHRDVKPPNIFLTDREHTSDFVKVLDFGLSAMNELGSTPANRTGALVGTPDYMAPEQARGEARIDHRVDIYAVGCVLYEALTGTPPFRAHTFMGVLVQHLFEAPQPPRLRAPAAEISPEVEAVVLRALAKDPRDRFQSARELAASFSEGRGKRPRARRREEESIVGGDPQTSERTPLFDPMGIVPSGFEDTATVTLPPGAPRAVEDPTNRIALREVAAVLDAPRPGAQVAAAAPAAAPGPQPRWWWPTNLQTRVVVVACLVGVSVVIALAAGGGKPASAIGEDRVVSLVAVREASPPTSPPPPAPVAEPDAPVVQSPERLASADRLRDAETSYVQSQFGAAIEQATPLLGGPLGPSAARLIAASSCQLRDRAGVLRVLASVAGEERPVLRRLCAAQGITLPIR